MSMLRLSPLVLLLLLGIWICGYQAYWGGAPLQRDISTYAVIGHEILQGRLLYADVWDHKPPAIHFTFALGELVFGYRQNSVLLLGCLALIGSLVAVFRIARSLAGDQAAGMAAVAWALLSGDLFLGGYQPNTEPFMNMFLLWALSLLLEVPQRSRPTLPALAAGVLIGIASLFKYIIMLPFAGFYAGLLLVDAAQRKLLIQNIPPVVLGLALPWAGCMLYFLHHEALGEFYRAVFEYNQFYSGSVTANLAAFFSVQNLLPRSMYPLIPFFAVFFFAAARAGAGLERRQFIPVGLMLVGALLAVALPGKYYNHYYQLLVPPLCLGLALASRAVSRAVVVLLLAALFVYEASFLRYTPTQWSFLKHGKVYLASRELGEYLGAHLSEATVFQWGSDTAMYFYARKSPPVGVFYALPLLEGPLAEDLTNRTLHQLQLAPPDYVVIDPKTAGRTPAQHLIRQWIETNYSLHEVVSGYPILKRAGM